MSSENDSDEEWEEVDGAGNFTDHLQEPTTSRAAVEVVLQPRKKVELKGSKKNFLEKALAAHTKAFQQNLHKAHLLCLLANGLHLSRQCDQQLPQATLLSMATCHLLPSPPGREDLHRLLEWFGEKSCSLMEALRGNSCPEGLSTVQVLVALLRALGLRARLVLTLKPLPFKQSAKVQGVASVVVGVATCSSSEECAVKEQLLMEKGCPDQPIILLSSVASCSSSKTNQEGCPVLNGSGKSLACGRQRGRGQKRTRLSPEEEGGGEASKGYKGKGKKPKKDDEPRPPTAKEVTEEVLTPVASKKLKGGGGRRMKKDATPPPTERKRTLRSNSKICSTDVAEGQGGGAEDQGGGANEDEGEDDDISIVMSPKGKRKRRLVPSHRDSVVEGEGPTPHPCGGEGPTPHPCGGEGPTPHPCGGEGSTPHPCDPTGGEVTAHLYDANNSWAEVYLEGQRKWVCLHCASSTVDCPQLCERHAPHPPMYVIGIENDRVRDVTPRYASNWCTSTRRMRLSEEWWRETLEPYAVDHEEGLVEDGDILNLLSSQPLPMSVAEYKGHPLYVLKRHLLKFEAIYPEDSKVVGHCRGEAVYERKCVYTLHSRESWLKEARVVKRGERAYKVVKARKSSKIPAVLGGEGNTLEVYGLWQTEVYTPPPVVEGRVPRNEYGNIELFQPSMLPQGACHLRVPGIQRVARKLGVDYAQAMVGWDYHGGSSHPVFDGIVVAMEHRNLLSEAAEQEEQISIEKDLKKREQRVVDHWKKLCKGLLIRERVKKTYNLV